MNYPSSEPVVYHLDDIERMANSPRPCKYLDAILLKMIHEGASEVRLGFTPRDIEVDRCVNGEWVACPAPPPMWSRELIGRLKEITGIEALRDKEEKRRLKLVIPGKMMDSEVCFHKGDTEEIADVRFVMQPGS